MIHAKGDPSSPVVLYHAGLTVLERIIVAIDRYIQGIWGVLLVEFIGI